LKCISLTVEIYFNSKFPGSKERPGRDADPSPPSSAVGHERVELYLYSSLWTVRPVQSLSIAIPLLPLWAVRPVQSLSACTRVYFTFTFTTYRNAHSSHLQFTLFWLAVFDVIDKFDVFSNSAVPDLYILTLKSPN